MTVVLVVLLIGINAGFTMLKMGNTSIEFTTSLRDELGIPPAIVGSASDNLVLGRIARYRNPGRYASWIREQARQMADFDTLRRLLKVPDEEVRES